MIKKYKVDHNDVNIDRGEWRIFNPYDPIGSRMGDSGGNSQTLENLDSLFQEEEGLESDINPADKLPVESNMEETPIKQLADRSNKENTIPVNSEPIENDDDLIDIQKELEAKFDELFGDMDD